MKRPCFALTLLLASLAGSFLAVDSAQSQTGAWHEYGCPRADGEASSPSICHGEDARWQAHQAEESDYNYRSDYDAGYDDEVYGTGSAETAESDAMEQAAAEPRNDDEPQIDATSNDNQELDPYGTQDSDRSVNEELDPYRTQNEHASGDELDPYWTQSQEAAPQEESNPVADPVTSVEDDNSWNQTHVYGNESTEENFFENESNTESAGIDSQWARDAANTVESWIERLSPRSETQADEVPENDVAADENQTVENVAPPAPQESADPTYGAHLWDDCELGSNHWECERPTPIASNESDEAAPSHDQAALETRDLLLLVAHSLNEAGLALQTASASIASFASEGIVTDSSAADGIDEYRD